MVYAISQESNCESASGPAAGIWNNNATVWLSTHHRDFLLAGRRMVPLGTHDMDKFTTITVEQRDAIEILSLNRPDALNAVTPAMADELIDYFSGSTIAWVRASSSFGAMDGRSAPALSWDRTRSLRRDQDGRSGSLTCSSATRGSSV